MSLDLTKLNLYTPDDAFKNVNSYSGSLTFPTTLAAGTTSTPSLAIPLTVAPVFTVYFAQFLELTEATFLYNFAAGTTPQRWYSGNTASASSFNIGIHVNAPAGNVGWLGATMYPIINGTIVTMTGNVFNPYGNSITFDSLIVPFVFIEYTLAN